MVIKRSAKKLATLTISVLMIISIFASFCVGASAAAAYPSVKLDVPRISQTPGAPDCAIASIATVEAYCHKLPAGDYRSQAYQAVYAANNYSYGANWSGLGYERINSFDMKTIYKQLTLGYPVIVHRSSSHFSVVYGYNGNTSKLSLSGFLLIEVDEWFNNGGAYQTLAYWADGYALDGMVLRHNGVSISSQKTKINGNHPAKYTIAGSSFTPYGRVISSKNLSNVTVSVKNSAGKAVQSFSVNPNSTRYAISNASDKIKINKLPTGGYTYTVSAKDSTGNTIYQKYDFKVVSDSSSVPPDVNDKPVIKDTSYPAIVLADPSLNMRTGPGMSYSIITSLKKDTVVDVTGTCDGWARVNHDGAVGWVSMKYIKEYEAPTVYAFVDSSVLMKNSTNALAPSTGRIPDETVVKVLSEDSGWVKVECDGKTGWIKTSDCRLNVADVDSNNVINSADALTVIKYTIGTAKLNPVQMNAADVNGDGKINSYDALVILQTATK